MKLTFSQSILFSVCSIFVSNMNLGCSEPTYTYRCACNKIAYDAEGAVLDDDSFNQVVCDTTENIEAVFEGELSELAQDCSAYFDGLTGIAQTDCLCTCDLIGDCN